MICNFISVFVLHLNIFYGCCPIAFGVSKATVANATSFCGLNKSVQLKYGPGWKSGPRNRFIRSLSHFVNNEKMINLQTILLNW